MCVEATNKDMYMRITHTHVHAETNTGVFLYTYNSYTHFVDLFVVVDKINNKMQHA